MDFETVGCRSPTWAPDGSQLVFTRRSLMQAAIVIAQADGTDWWEIDQGQSTRVFWLPSGEQVGFTGGVCDVRVLSADFLLTRGSSESGPFPCLNLDFEELGVNMPSDNGVAWSPRLDTQFAVQAPQFLQIVDLARYTVDVYRFGSKHFDDPPPSWSSDGERLALAANDGNDSEIYVLNLASHEVVQLTDNEVDDFIPEWQP